MEPTHLIDEYIYCFRPFLHTRVQESDRIECGKKNWMA